VSTTHDVIIIGGGMAGASVGFELAADRRVLVLEAEEQPGYHATGRSAAAYIPSYGFDNPALRCLTLASRSSLESPAPDFHEGTFLKRRGLLSLAHEKNLDQLRSIYEAQRDALPGIEWVGSDTLHDAVPLLRDEYTGGAICEQDVFDIDVHGLHESYLKGLKRRGGVCESNSPVRTISRTAKGWQVDTANRSYSAPVIVNATGAWADEVAALAGVSPIGIQPLRRTAILLETPVDTDAWPLVMETGVGFYFKPDAGLLLVSPADETPSPACDAAPEELDVAYAAHYAEQTLDLDVRQIKHSWAGLRSFVADRTPVIGFDGAADGFFWLVGQGGHGIQIAPATAMLAAALIAGQELPPALMEQGFDLAWVSPARLATENRNRA
jgi:D-arginine dehydrogenase